MGLKEILVFETALDEATSQQVEQMAGADIVIGIPSYRNARTIGRVAQVAVEGLQTYFPEMRGILINADGGSSDDTRNIIADMPVGPQIKKLAFIYRGLLGKGTGVRGIFEIAKSLHAKVCIVLEPDVISVKPEWIKTLARPVLDGGYDFVAPLYRQPPMLAGLNDLVAYPLTRLLYGGDIRHPISANFGVSGEFVADACQRDVWETDIARYGIDIWLATVALNENRPMCQARLGTRQLGSREEISPRNLRALQILGTLFRMMNIYRKIWQTGRMRGSIPILGRLRRVARHEETVDLEALATIARAGEQEHGWAWRSALSPADYDAIRATLKDDPANWRFPLDLWARIVIDFAVVYNRGESDPDKIALAFLPLYYARMVSFISETVGKSAREIEESVQAQAKTFLDLRTYLLERWYSYVPWISELPQRRSNR